MTNIISMYAEVKETYFKNWNSAKQWRVELKDQLSDWYLGNAYTNQKTKNIEIYESFATNDDNVWRCLIVHQITHVISGANHNQKWMARFLEVAKQADLNGQKSLATLIREDAEASRDMMEPNINPILQNIKATVVEQPDVSFETVVDSAARAMGISGDELLKRCPLVKTYYDSVKDAVLKERRS